MGKKELFDVTVQKKAETAKAWLLNDGKKEEWFPKSQCELHPEVGCYILTAPISLLQEKGFI